MWSVIKKVLRGLEGVLVIVFSMLSMLLGSSISWMFKTWNHLSMDELLYQLNAPIEGTNTGMIKDYIQYCIPGVLVVFLIVLAVVIGLWKKGKWYHITLVGIVLLSIINMIYFGIMTWNRLDIGNYSKNKNTESDFIDDNYVDARDVQLVFPENKRNLIYIFLESMETTYVDQANGGAFEENCIPELTILAQENEDFSGSEIALNGGFSMPATTWTVAAMFAQTSGLPLDIPVEDNSMDQQESFFPSIVTIGDILQEQGYSQTLFIGSDATFGGRRLLFTDHGNYDIKDYYYAKEQGKLPDDYWVWWGYEDERLFNMAKEELLELSQQDEPFNFTMLTVDTHFEDGYVCNLCEDDFEGNQYANVMACSSRQVYEFVRWIQQQDFYENTTIVISGDHPTMDSDFCEGIDSEYVRKVYTTYINSAVQVENPEERREYTTFDQYPTTLASLGVQIEGNRLGLGTNLFSGELTLAEKYGRDRMKSELQKDSKLMKKLAESIEVEEEITQETVTPSANIYVLDYNYEIGALPVVIADFANADNGISAINVAVWTEEDQSDLQWMQAVDQGDGSYIMNINVPNFDYKTGDYHIDIYIVDNDGNQQMIGSATGYVE